MIPTLNSIEEDVVLIKLKDACPIGSIPTVPKNQFTEDRALDLQELVRDRGMETFNRLQHEKTHQVMRQWRERNKGKGNGVLSMTERRAEFKKSLKEVRSLWELEDEQLSVIPFTMMDNKAGMAEKASK
jgi:hypothetical protein